MRIYELFHSLINKFAPLDKQSESQLQLEAIGWYSKHAEDAKNAVSKNLAISEYNENKLELLDFEPKNLIPITLKDRVMIILESWYVRYIIAIAFLYLVPKVKNYLNGNPDASGEDVEEEDDEQNEFEEFQKFKRYNKQL